MTLVELMVVLGLLGVVVAGLLSVLNTAQGNLGRQISRTDSNDQLRLAEESIDREVRSGNVVYNPCNTFTLGTGAPSSCSGSSETYSSGQIAPGMSLRIWTASNNPTRGGDWCEQWRITSSTSSTPNQLQERRWTPNWTDAHDLTQVTKWRTVATGITNATEGVPAFFFTGTGNLLSVHLRANNDSVDAAGHAKALSRWTKGSTVEADMAVNGRNTQLYPAGSFCGPQTPAPYPSTNAADNTSIPAY